LKNAGQLIINHKVKQILCINFPDNCKRGGCLTLWSCKKWYQAILQLYANVLEELASLNSMIEVSSMTNQMTIYRQVAKQVKNQIPGRHQGEEY